MGAKEAAPSPPLLDGGAHSPPSPPPALPQQALSLLTQGMNLHATRLDALARAISRLERGALLQAEQAEQRATEAAARAEAAEERSERRQREAEERSDAARAELERRVAELETRLEGMPPALEELRSRATTHDAALDAHGRDLSQHAARIADGAQARAALTARVDGCASSDALEQFAELCRTTQTALREQVGDVAQMQRRDAAHASGSIEAHARRLEEVQAALSSLQRQASDAAAGFEIGQKQMGELGAAQHDLEAAQAQLAESTQLGLARATAAAETAHKDSDRITGSLAEVEGYARRLERIESDLTSHERAVGHATEELRRTAEHLEETQRHANTAATQQVALHVKALSGDLLRELNQKASIVDTQQIFDALHKQVISIKESHRSLSTRVEAQGMAAEQVADEAAAAALQAQGALRGSDQIREETRLYLRSQLEERPTVAGLETAAAQAAEAAVRSALSLEGTFPAYVDEVRHGSALSSLAQTPGVVTPAPLTPGSTRLGRLPQTPAGNLIEHVRQLLFSPLEARLEALEGSTRTMQSNMVEASSSRSSMHDEMSRKYPSLEQVETLQATLSAHVQRLPALAAYPHGRWMWKGGRLRSTGRAAPPSLPWGAERLNTSPDTFGWVADRPTIEVAVAGLYELSCAVFAPGSPTISVAINGSTVLRRAASVASSRGSSASRQLLDSSGMVAGASIRDVLSLVAGAKVGVQFESHGGDAGGMRSMTEAHGMLELKQIWC